LLTPGPDHVPTAAVGQALTLIGRLIPFPASDFAAPLAVMPAMAGQAGRTTAGAPPGIAPSPHAGPDAGIVSQAAAILDEEMALGVVAARSLGQAGQMPGLDAGVPLMRQLHDLIDKAAAAWPSAARPSGLDGGTGSAHPGPGPLPEVKPPGAVRPGQTATIAMRLCNREGGEVRLRPAATDLLGGDGARLASTLLDFQPAEVNLQPGDEAPLQIRVAIPPGTPPGTYGGLLVVSGARDLRAVILLDVR
jgi:hypothetical protein